MFRKIQTGLNILLQVNCRLWKPALRQLTAENQPGDLRCNVLAGRGSGRDQGRPVRCSGKVGRGGDVRNLGKPVALPSMEDPIEE